MGETSIRVNQSIRSFKFIAVTTCHELKSKVTARDLTVKIPSITHHPRMGNNRIYARKTKRDRENEIKKKERIKRDEAKLDGTSIKNEHLNNPTT